MGYYLIAVIGIILPMSWEKVDWVTNASFCSIYAYSPYVRKFVLYCIILTLDHDAIEEVAHETARGHNGNRYPLRAGYTSFTV